MSASTPKVFDTISRSQYSPSYVSHSPLCKQINLQSITNVFEIQPNSYTNRFHQSGLELNITPGSPLVLLLVGKLGDAHVWATQSIVNSRRIIESQQLSRALPFSSSNTDMRDSIFSNASFAVVSYIYNISNTTLPNNPYDFPLLVDTTCSLLKALGALDPLGGGRYPLDALIVVDPSGSVRVLMPISTWGFGNVPKNSLQSESAQLQRGICSTDQLEKVLTETLTYLLHAQNDVYMSSCD